MKKKKDIYKVNVENIGASSFKKQKRILEKAVALTHIFPDHFISAIKGVLKLYNDLKPNYTLGPSNKNFSAYDLEVSVKEMKIQKWAILQLSADELQCKLITKRERDELEGILNLYDHIQDDCESQGANKHDVFTLPKNDSLKAEVALNDRWSNEMDTLNNYIKDSILKNEKGIPSI